MEIDIQGLGLLAGAMMLAGATTGLLGGLLGVGGGFILVPALLVLFAALDVDEAVRMQLAVGTSLSTMIATSVSSVRSHHKRGAVDWHLFGIWAPAVAAGVLAGAWVAGALDGRTFTIIFAGVALAAAAQMMFMPEGVRLADRLPGPSIMTPTGIVIGALSSMAGIGGAIMSVPVMVLCNYPVRRAVGTAAAVGMVIALFGTLGFIASGWNAAGRPALSLGFVNALGFAVLAPMTALFAPVGARLAHTLNPLWLKRILALFLAITSIRLLWGLMP